MKTGLLLSVREKATRLPGKVLKSLGDGNVTQFLLRRLKTVAGADTVILATSTDPRDAVLVEIAEREGVIAFRGSEDDKLRRYRDAAHTYDLDFVVVIDGDDPFVSTRHIEGLIATQADDPADFLVWEGLPLGATGFGVATTALEHVCAGNDGRNTEIWGHLFTENPAYRCVVLKESEPLYNRPDIRMTLDYPEDLEFFRNVVNQLTDEGAVPSFENVMRLLAREPGIVSINAGVAKKYERHLAASRSES